ncbi:hypothetical protein [Kitasatospora sp. NPDC093102]|uniref:hypothetical protein n=1 Tax=Kitasatospora sp. NPDC093102 TaxID=3155069 RepID=UPI00342C5868
MARALTLCRSGGGPFQPVEDQVEPELELVAVRVAGLQHMPGGACPAPDGRQAWPARKDLRLLVMVLVDVIKDSAKYSGEPLPIV